MHSKSHGRRFTRVVSVVAALVWLWQTTFFVAVKAATVGNSATGSGGSLDLSSHSQTWTAPNTKPVNIILTGSSGNRVTHSLLQVQPGQSLTAAEYLAVQQVLSQGRQGLLLNAVGAAIGGAAAVNSSSGIGSLSSLVVPAGVKLATVGFNAGTPFDVSGHAVIDGSLFALQAIRNAGSTLDFGSLQIDKTGLLTANVSASRGTFANLHLFSSNALTLNVAQALDNAGTISNGQGALTIYSGSGQITNSGTIQSKGCLAIDSSRPLSVYGDGGTFQSTKGAVLLSTAMSPVPSNIAVHGGNFKAASGGIGFDAPGGTVQAFANRLDGAVTIDSANADVGAAHGNVRISNSHITDDPLFYAQNGDLDISGIGFSGSATSTPDGNTYYKYSSSGSDFVALASGNITCTGCDSNFSSTSTPSMIDTSNTSQSGAGSSETLGIGGNIAIAAGVNFSVNGATGSCTTCGTNYQLLGPSSTGGNVQLANVALRTNNSNVSVQANSGSSSSGTIALLSAETSGLGGLGANSSHQTGGAGQSAGSIAIIANGTSSASTVTIGTGTTGFLRAYGGGGGGAYTVGNLNIVHNAGGKGGTGGAITVTAPGDITINGDVNASGGGGGGNYNTTTLTSGDGGAINIISGGKLILAGPVLSAAGGGAGNSNTSSGNPSGGGGSFGGGGGAGQNTTGGAGGGIQGGGSGGISNGTGWANGGGGFFGGGGYTSGLVSTAGSIGMGGGNTDSTLGFGSGGLTRGSGADAGDAGNPGGGSNYGTGGAINLSAVGTLQVLSSVDTFAPFAAHTGFTASATPALGYSVYNTSNFVSGNGSGGPLLISTPGFNNLPTNVDLSSTSNSTSYNPITTTIFHINGGSNVVTSNPSYSGSYGYVYSESTKTLINGNNGLVAGTTQSFKMSTSSLTLTESSSTTSALNSGGTNFALTLAEGVALLQKIQTGTQSLTLTGSTTPGSGVASGGSVSLYSANTPSGGYGTLVVPTGVTVNVSSPGLSFASGASNGLTVNTTGKLVVAPSTPGAGWISAPNIVIVGSGSTLATNISFSSVYKTVTDGAGTYAGIIMSPSGSDLSFTTTAGTTSAGIAASITGGGALLVEASTGHSVKFLQDVAGTSTLTLNGVSSGSGTSAIVSDTAVDFADGVIVSANNSLAVQSPTIVAGYLAGTGSVSSTLSATTAINIYASSSQTGTLTISADTGTTATLNLNSTSVALTADALVLAPSTSITNSTASSTSSFTANTSLSIGSNDSVTSSGAVAIITPSVVIGAGTDSGSILATITASTAATVKANSGQTGTLTFSSHAGVTAELDVNTPTLTMTADTFEVGTNTTVQNGTGNVIVQAKSGDSLNLPAAFAGSLIAVGQTVTFSSDTAIYIENGAGLNFSNSSVVFQTPNIYVGLSGASGAQSASIWAQQNLTFQTDAAQDGVMTIGFTGSAGTLEVDAFSYPSFVANSFVLPANMSVNSNNNGVNVQANSGSITLSGGGSFGVAAVIISAPTSIALTSGFNYTAIGSDIFLCSPSISLSGTSTFNSGSLRLEPNSTPSGSLSISGSGTLSFPAGFEYIIADTFSLAAGSTLSHGTGSFSISAPGTDALTIGSNSGGTISYSGEIPIISSTSISFANGSSLTCSNCGFTLQTPQVIVGVSGDTNPSASLTGSNLQLLIEGNSSGTGSLTISTLAGAGSGTLILNGSGGNVLKADTIAIGSSTTVASTIGALQMYSIAGDALIISSATSGSVTGGLNVQPGNGLVFANGANLSVSGSVTIITPTITVGTASGASSATISSDTGISLKAVSGGTGTLTINSAASGNGTLNANGANTTITADSLSIASNTTLASNQNSASSITIQSAGTGFTLPASSAGNLSTPGSVLITDGNSVTFANASNLSVTGALIIQAPIITVGATSDSGSASATLNATNGFTLTASGALTLQSNSNIQNNYPTYTGTLTMNGSAVTVTSSSLSLNTLTLASDHGITLQSTMSLVFPDNGFAKLAGSSNTIYSPVSISLGDNFYLDVTGSLNIYTPNLIMGAPGDTGNLNLDLVPTSNLNLQGDLTTHGSFQISTVGTASSSTLNLNVSGTITATVSSFAVVGTQTDVFAGTNTIIQSDSSHSLTLPATWNGTFNPNPSITFASINSINFANGSNMVINGNVNIYSPSIVVGVSGDPSSSTAFIQQSSGSTQIAPSSSLIGTVALSNGGTVSTGTLEIAAPGGINVVADSFSIGSGTTLQNDTYKIAIAANNNAAVAVSGTGTLSTPFNQSYITSNSSVSFANGTSLASSGNLTVQAPSIIIGVSGASAQTSSLSSTGSIILQAQSDQKGTFNVSVLAGASSGTLSLSGTSGNTVYCSVCQFNTASISASSITVKSATGASNSLSIASTSNATFTGNLTLQSDKSISFQNGTNIAGTTVTIQTPSLIVGYTGDTGTIGATISGGTMTVGNNGGTSLTVTSLAGTTGTLHLNGAAANITSNNFSVGSGTTLANDQSGTSFLIQPTGSTLTLTAANAGSISAAGTIEFEAATSIVLANGSSLAASGGGNLLLQAPTIVAGASGDSGTVSSTITISGGGQYEIQGDSAGTSALSFALGGSATAGTVNLNGAPTTISTQTFSLPTAMTISSSSLVSVSSSTTLTIVAATKGSIVSNGTTFTAGSSITLQNGVNLNLSSYLWLKTPQLNVGSAGDTGNVTVSVTAGGGVSMWNDIGGGAASNFDIHNNTSSANTTLILNGGDVHIGATELSMEPGTSGASIILQSDHGVTVFGNSGQALTLKNIDASIVALGVDFVSYPQLYVANGANLSITGGLQVETAQLVVGVATDGNGPLSATISATGPIILCTTAALFGSFSMATTSTTSGTLNVNGAPVSVIANQISLPAGVALASDHAVTLESNFEPLIIRGGGTVNGTSTAINSVISVSFATGTALNFAGNLSIQTPSIIVGVTGDTGNLSASLTVSGATSISVSAGANPLSISTLANATSGTLNLNGADVTVSAASVAIAANTTLASDHAITFNVTTGLSDPPGASVYSPVGVTISSTSGDVGAVSQYMVISTPILNITLGGSGSAYVIDPQALSQLTGSVGGQFNTTDPVSITIGSSGVTANTSVSLVTPLLNNNNSITATGGNSSIDIFAPSGAGNNLQLSGNGTISAGANAPGSLATNGTIVIGSSNDVSFSGNYSLTAGTLTISAPIGSVSTGGNTVAYNGALTINTNISIGSPSDYSPQQGSPAPTINVISSANSIGTIVNPSGDVVLASGTIINSSGKNLAIIARGNIYSTGITTINLSSTTSNGGSLSVFAGMASTPAPTGTIDTTTAFTVTGPSTTGGSVNLSGVSINLASTAPTTSSSKNGGSLLITASKGSDNAGNIFIGAINTSSTNGNAGNVYLAGAGGVTVNGAINASGKLHGGNVTLAASPVASIAPSFTVYDGFTVPADPFSAVSTSPATGSGAAVVVKGAITTSSSGGFGGYVDVESESLLQLTSGITTTGASRAGNVTLNSLNGALSVGGAITASGGNVTSTTSSAAAGNGANILVTAPSSITIKGTVSSAGGKTAGTGKGGDAGTITIQTTQPEGNLLITGAVNASGGAAKTTAGGGAGGNAAAINLSAGAMQIKGTVAVGTNVGSVVSVGGVGAAAAGSSNSITITTHATQQIPANFNLTSTTASIYALPGGLFNIGNASVNGTTGSIIGSGGALTSLSNANITTSAATGSVSVNVVAGSSNSINIGGVNTPISSGATNAARTKVTPAEALALYQVSLGGAAAQTVDLTSTGQATSSSSITVPEYDLPQPFTSFVLATTTGGGINLTITGATPTLDISKSGVPNISGTIDFSNATTAMISAGALAVKVNAGAAITAANELALKSSGVWTNNGTISAGSDILLLDPLAAFSLTNNGSLSGTTLMLPANAMPTTFTFINRSGSPMSTTIEPIQLPSTFGTVAYNMTAGSKKAATSTINLTAGGSNGPAVLIGAMTSASIGTLNINSKFDTVTKQTTDLELQGSFASTTAIAINANHALTFDTGSNLVSSKLTATAVGLLTTTGTTISTPGALTLTSSAGSFVDQGGSSFGSDNAISISAKTAVTIANNSSTNITAGTGLKIASLSSTVALAGPLSSGTTSIATVNGSLKLQAPGAISIYANLKAGAATGTATGPSNKLLNADISRSGSITVTSGTTAEPGGVTIGSGYTIETDGKTTSPGNITFTVIGGDISIGSNNTFTANGGNLKLLTTGNILAPASGANTFNANGVAASSATGAAATGGGIELGAGSTVSQLAAALLKAPGTVPNPQSVLGSNVVIYDPNQNPPSAGTSGVVQANVAASGGTISLGNTSNGTTTQATLTLNGGAIVIDVSNSKSVTLNGSVFNTSAYKPIGYGEDANDVSESDGEFVVDTGLDVQSIIEYPQANAKF